MLLTQINTHSNGNIIADVSFESTYLLMYIYSRYVAYMYVCYTKPQFGCINLNEYLKCKYIRAVGKIFTILCTISENPRSVASIAVLSAYLLTLLLINFDQIMLNNLVVIFLCLNISKMKFFIKPEKMLTSGAPKQ